MRYAWALLLIPSITFADNASDAIAAAQQAAFVQTGAQDATNKLGIYVLERTKMKKELTALFSLYTVAKTQQITIPLHEKKLIFTPNSASLEVNF